MELWNYSRDLQNCKEFRLLRIVGGYVLNFNTHIIHLESDRRKFPED